MAIRHLFRGPELRTWLQEQLATVLEQIAQADAMELDEVGAEGFARRAEIEPPRLNTEAKTRSEIREIRIDARRLPDAFERGVEGPGPPVMIDGREVEFYIPFEGNEELFDKSPNLMGPPRPQSAVEDDVVRIEVSGPADQMSSETIRAQLAREIDLFERWIQATNKQVEEHNAALHGEMARAIERRRKRLTDLDDLENDLDIPIDGEPPGPSRNW